jgi:hypothetical protein
MPPIFFSKADSPKCPHAYRDYSYTRSKIHERVVMMKQKNSSNTHEDENELVDRTISFVLTEALQVLYPHYDIHHLKNVVSSSDSTTQSNLYSFARSCHFVKKQVVSLLQRIDTYETQLSNTTSTKALEVKHPDFQGLLSCLTALGSCLSMVGACLFVQDLLSFDGVQEAISDAGGWTDLQRLACLLTKHGMVVDFESDESSSSSSSSSSRSSSSSLYCDTSTSTNAAHFSLLQDVPLLHESVTQFLADFSDTQRLLEAKLQHLWDKFYCGTFDH